MHYSLVWPATCSEKTGVFIDAPQSKNRFVTCVSLNITLVTSMALPFSRSCLQTHKSTQCREAVSASHTQSSSGVETCQEHHGGHHLVQTLRLKGTPIVHLSGVSSCWPPPWVWPVLHSGLLYHGQNRHWQVNKVVIPDKYPQPTV